MNSENKLIIEQLNKFGRVPQTYELLQMIEQMEQENKQLQEELKFTIGIVEHNRIISEKNKEINQLKDNWNKLKELTINSLNFYKGTDCEYIKTQREFGIREAYRIILGKMQEIEQEELKN